MVEHHCPQRFVVIPFHDRLHPKNLEGGVEADHGLQVERDLAHLVEAGAG